jgi:hypothetical protein
MNRSIKAIKLTVAGAGLAVLVFSCGRHKPAANRSAPAATPEAQVTPGQADGIIGAAESKLLERDLKFNHNRPEHKKQDCSLCHKRIDNSATPKFPGHAACLACHAADFTSSNNKLCVVCHIVPLEAQPKMAVFPAKLIQFGLKEFSHKQHFNPAKMPAGTAVPKCDSCHQFDNSLIQAGFPDHPQCYSCHTHQPGEKLGGCMGCHADQSVALKFIKGTGNAAALYNFTHGGHFKQASIQRNCDKCHHLLDRDLQHPDILQISTARGQRHTSGCWTCHVQAREPVCSKCHVKGPPV